MRRIAIVTAGMIGAAMLGGPPVQADPGTATHVDSLSAAISGSNVQISGAATFVDVPVQVGTDPDNPNAPPGADLRTATISRPNPAKKELVMNIGVDNMPAPTDGTPLIYYYNWSILVSDPSGDTSEYLVQANRAPGSSLPETDPIFRVLTCVTDPTTGNGDCTETAALTGTFSAATGITFNVPISNIGVKTGSTISIGPNNLVATVGAGAAGADVWFTNFGGDSMSHDDYIVPGPTVKLGIAPAGTDPAAVPLTKDATVATNGSSFSGTLTKPTPGSYVVVASACWTSADCVRASTDITVE